MKLKCPDYTIVRLFFIVSVILIVGQLSRAEINVEQYSRFDMAVEQVAGNDQQVAVRTTGAEYILSRTEMVMVRRIDPRTNTENPREIARLDFFNDIGPLQIVKNNAHTAVVESTFLSFQFVSDSFVLVTSKQPFQYTHRNMIVGVPWARGENSDRLWTDGYGGSLHARCAGSVQSVESPDATVFTILPGQTVGHMVFPPKRFDFDSLYGMSARPFVQWITDYVEMANVSENFDYYSQNGVGVFHLWANHYRTSDEKYESPELIPFTGYPEGIMGYEYADEQKVREFVDQAHARGFKVITYLSTPSHARWNYPTGHPRAGEHQEVSLTLVFMKYFQDQYNLDGWYFDNGDAGEIIDDYQFMRQVRTDIGVEGILFHHDSVDVWGNWSGLVAVMVDAYVDYTLKGETGRGNGLSAQVHDPNDDYFRFYTAGYGMAQTYAAHKRKSTLDVAMSEQEKRRVVGQNLNGCERNLNGSWFTHFKPAYDLRKTAYLSGEFNPDISIPINPSQGWFRAPGDIAVTVIDHRSVQITWTTNEPSTSEVAYTSNGVWWYTWHEYFPDGPDGEIKDETLVYDHSIVLSDLQAKTQYEYRIRSQNKKEVPQEIIWGHVGLFTTPEEIQDPNPDPEPEPDTDPDPEPRSVDIPAFTQLVLYNNILSKTSGNRVMIYGMVQEPGNLLIEVYNSSFRLIRVLCDEFRTPGTHEFFWDGTDMNGSTPGSGIFFVRMQINDFIETKKIILVR
ncbi:MAG: hypothetical protein GF384_05265 [Elusimicrobia bacterium]|nr:hypothetical protein [Elusimicrobiota bacterium]